MRFFFRCLIRQTILIIKIILTTHEHKLFITIQVAVIMTSHTNNFFGRYYFTSTTFSEKILLVILTEEHSVLAKCQVGLHKACIDILGHYQLPQ